MKLTRDILDLYDRYSRLQTVDKLRTMIRRMWRVDIDFIDTTGKVIDPHRGTQRTEKRNPFCNQCLWDREGVKGCDQTARKIASEIRTSGRVSSHVFEECHAGFRYLVLPVFQGDKWIGAVTAGGFTTRPIDDEKKKQILETTQKYNGMPIKNVEVAFQEVSVLSPEQLVSLEQMLSFGVEEVMRYRDEERKRRATVIELKGLENTHKFGSQIIVGNSRAMKNLFEMMGKLQNSDSSVLLQGENGTGKELVAKAIHHASTRKDKPFVNQNCSAMNDNLLDSELFGHVKGSFTGAIRDKKGLFEVANGGTFFMDEVGDMSPMLQVKLLRVLQEGVFIPVGGTESKYVNVRIVAATNKDLKKMVLEGNFREDLYYRLNVINLVVPSLRDRREDIPLLVQHFLNKFAQHLNWKQKTITSEALDVLMAYNWPGNVRQLENEVQRAIVMSGKSLTIDRDVLSPQITGTTSSIFQVKISGKLKEMLAHLERQILLDGLRKWSWNKSKLSKELGISRATLLWKIEKYGIDRTAQP